VRVPAQPGGVRDDLVKCGLRAALVLLLAATLLAGHAQRTGAVILPAVTIDGPSQEILGFGGVAMAEDGAGGLVYLKRVNGVPHVFVSRFIGGRWLSPIEVDTGEPYAASSPRIGAASGGELEVVWTTPFATKNQRPVYELLGATLGPGATMFAPAMIVDPNIREALGASPDLAMSSTGQADVVYRVVEQEPGQVSPIPLLRPGDVAETVRVAHFDGTRWTRLGPINRNPGISMRSPTQANAPQLAIGATGNGVVVWQEPEIEGVARIFARRLFGSTLDYVLPVSVTSFGGAPILQDADAPSVAVSQLGQAEVAYRQVSGPGSPLPGARIFVNTLPDGESASGAEFAGASLADAGATGDSVGRPSIDIDEKRDVRLLYHSNGTPRVVQGNDRGLVGALSLGPSFVGSEATPADEVPSASVMNPEGGGVSAWPSVEPGGATAVAVREDFPEGAVQTALVSGGDGGPISELSVGRSGLGDGLVAFQQGPFGNAAIVAATATAPPEPFVTNVPKGWIEPSRARVSWLPAASANGPLTYTAVLDGRRVPTPAGASSVAFNPHGLGSGVHHVQVLAADIYGQSTLSAPSELLIDGQPPLIKVSRRGPTVTVRVSDAYSGVDVHAVSVSFGDGTRAHARTVYHHRYAHAGAYTVVVHVRDKLGNQATVRQLVSA
jgi:PKD domain-containing protein